jgi:putative hydrolase of the HAD superfamily
MKTESSRLPFKAVLFDLDNTLVDLIAAKRHACGVVTKFIGIEDDGELFEYFRRPVHHFESHEHLRDYLVDHGLTGGDLLLRCMYIHDEEKLDQVQAYDGVADTLACLRERGLRLAVVTDAYQEAARARLERTGLFGYIDRLVTTDMTGRKKPDPAPFLLALELLEVRPEEAIIIGDSLMREIAPGNRLGIATAHAEYGDRNGGSRDGGTPDYVLSEIREITRILGL